MKHSFGDVDNEENLALRGCFEVIKSGIWA